MEAVNRYVLACVLLVSADVITRLHQHPGNLRPEKICQVPFVGRLLRGKPFRRMAGFANCKCTLVLFQYLGSQRFNLAAFHTYAPKMYSYYSKELSTLYAHDSTLRPPFDNCVWPACTFNLGPGTCCLGHCDSPNVPHGWCAVWSMGPFDPKFGGHLILEEFNLIIEFPPGSLILIPSSTIRHGNTPVRDDERRYSFTQYCAGGLMRWVHHGMVPEWALTDTARKEAYGKKGERWREALGMYSVYDELTADHAACCGSEIAGEQDSKGSEE